LTSIKVKLTAREFILWLSGLVALMVLVFSTLYEYMSLEALEASENLEKEFPFLLPSELERPSYIYDVRVSLYAACV